MNLSNESKTLFIPLFAKSVMSKNNLFLHDLKAEEIVSKIDYDFNLLKQSKWLSMYMALRASIMDNLCNRYFYNHENTTIIHLGCGLDSRCLRVNQDYDMWYDIDYQNVIKLRNLFYTQSKKYKMIESSVLDYDWMEQIKVSNNILIVAEGLMMYLSETEIKDLLKQISSKFKKVHLIFDSYSKIAVKLSRIKNPVNQMGAEVKYGIDTPKDFLNLNSNLQHINTYTIKRENNNLNMLTRFIFNNLYCGKISQRLYKIYEFSL